MVYRQDFRCDIERFGPSFFGRIDDVYHWHILAKTTEPGTLLEDFTLKPGWYVDVDPVDIL